MYCLCLELTGLLSKITFGALQRLCIMTFPGLLYSTYMSQIQFYFWCIAKTLHYDFSWVMTILFFFYFFFFFFAVLLELHKHFWCNDQDHNLKGKVARQNAEFNNEKKKEKKMRLEHQYTGWLWFSYWLYFFVPRWESQNAVCSQIKFYLWERNVYCFRLWEFSSFLLVDWFCFIFGCNDNSLNKTHTKDNC